jgi:hypothetical protein
VIVFRFDAEDVLSAVVATMPIMALGRDGLKIKRGDGRNHVEAGLTFKTHRLQSAQPSWASSLTPI